MSNFGTFAISLGATVFLQTTPLSAQEMHMRVKDAGFGNHGIHGAGVELVLEVRGVAVRDIPDDVFGNICAHFGSEIISQVMATDPSFEPEYFGVRLINTGLLSQFKFIAFSPDGVTCGAPL